MHIGGNTAINNDGIVAAAAVDDQLLSFFLRIDGFFAVDADDDFSLVVAVDLDIVAGSGTGDNLNVSGIDTVFPADRQNDQLRGKSV